MSCYRRTASPAECEVRPNPPPAPTAAWLAAELDSWREKWQSSGQTTSAQVMTDATQAASQGIGHGPPGEGGSGNLVWLSEGGLSGGWGDAVWVERPVPQP